MLVAQTPYNKDGRRIRRCLRVPRPSAVTSGDRRRPGHRRSGGQWDSFGPDEQRDGYELVEWAAPQPWSDGKVGTRRPVLHGDQPALTAAQRPQPLKAMFPVVPMADSYRDITFSGGQVNTAFIPLWLGLVTGGRHVPDAPRARRPRRTDHAARPRRAASRFQLRRRRRDRPAARSRSTARSGRRARRWKSSTASTCRSSSSAAITTSSSAASRWSTNAAGATSRHAC